jgi:hypothetical protein
MLTRSSKRVKIHSISEYTSISSFKNTINNDRLLDYLELLNNKKREISLDTLEIKPKQDNLKKERKSSFEYIVENGRIFEEDVFEEIKRRMKINKDLRQLFDLRDSEDKQIKCDLTKEFLLNRKPMVILGGALYSKEREIFGYPDLIVSGKFIKKYFCEDKDCDYNYENEKKKKRKFYDLNDNKSNITKRDIDGNNIPYKKIQNTKYYIIDVKSSSLDLISRGDFLSNNKDYNFYKFQVYSYNNCLNSLFEENNLENNVDIGFLLGRKYKTRINKEDVYYSCFQNLACINFTNEFIEKNDEYCRIGKQWLVKDLGSNFSKFCLNPINRKELYPNMKNYLEGDYRRIKKRIADVNGEITQLYYCGVDKRIECQKMGIMDLNDERINSDILGFKNKANEEIIKKMLELNKSDKYIYIDKELNNCMDWQDKNEYEFFVDFETYSKSNISGPDEDIIYMIGVCYEEEFKCFIINNKYEIKKHIKKRKNEDLNCDLSNYVLCHDEYDLINRFTDYIYSKNNSKTDNCVYKKNARLIHWSNFEERVFSSKIEKYSLNKKRFTLNWYDLCNVFKYTDSPILIKKCWNFKLKDITNKMCEYNFIDLKWPDLEDGLLSSFMAKDIYENNDKHNKNNFIIDITEYNYIDCKTMYNILNFIRNY